MVSAGQQIFEQIGHLFYSIASRAMIKPLEIPELKMLISKYWRPETGEQGQGYVSYAAHIIVVTIDNLQGSGTDADSAYDSFAEFFEMHHDEFTPPIRKKILETVVAIEMVFPVKKACGCNYATQLKVLFSEESIASGIISFTENLRRANLNSLAV